MVTIEFYPISCEVYFSFKVYNFSSWLIRDIGLCLYSPDSLLVGTSVLIPPRVGCPEQNLGLNGCI